MINHLEILAVICCFINIYLAARAHVLNFLFGIAAVSLYFVIFFNAKLYADMSLQLVFLVLQFYGGYQWLSKKATVSNVFNEPFKTTYLIYGLLITAFLFITIAVILARYTDSTTIYIDAFITALSLVAQWMMSRKWLVHWWIWMVVDIISIKVFLVKELYFTSILYAILFILCIYGYLNWKKQLNHRSTLIYR